MPTDDPTPALRPRHNSVFRAAIETLRERYAICARNKCGGKLYRQRCQSFVEQLDAALDIPFNGEALADRRPVGWQPIASVPETAEFIVAAWEHGEVGEAIRDYAGAPWFACATNQQITPTHWQYLPDPPAEGGEARPQPSDRETTTT